MNGVYPKGKEKALMAAATMLFYAIATGLVGGIWDVETLALGAASLFVGLVVYFTPNSSRASTPPSPKVHDRFDPPSKEKKDDLYRRAG